MINKYLGVKGIRNNAGNKQLWFLKGVLVSLLFALCIGCSVGSANGGLGTPGTKIITKSLQHGGVERTYHIHLPPGFDKNKPAPLVLALHGGGGKGTKFNELTAEGTLEKAADERGVVIVYPEGINRQWNDGRNDIFRRGKPKDDVGFISKLIDKMAAEYGIDRKRVYSTGISNGGFMSVRLALELSEKITAVAPVTAQLSVAIKDKKPKLPISIMVLNGTEDPLVPYDGGHVRLFRFGRSRGEILSTAETIDRFRRHNDCSDLPEKKKLNDLDPNDGTTVEVEKYKCEKDATEVVLVKVIGGGHTWPGGKQYLSSRLVGTVSRDINASEMILDFFLKHSR
ncbi:MAG: esterase [Pyrinomonadaceae bacterium]|nr:esterase [Pyrinomonadaceae bacterium]